MAYTREEIANDFEGLTCEYIADFAEEALIRGAYRNEFCCDSRIDFSGVDRADMVKTVCTHLTFDDRAQTVWLNSTKTHAIPYKRIYDFWDSYGLMSYGY